MAIVHRNSQYLWLPTQGQASLSSSIDGGGASEAPPLAKKLLGVNEKWGIEIYFHFGPVTKLSRLIGKERHGGIPGRARGG